MTSMSSCPYCTTQVPEKLNFCPQCEKQVRCLECKEELYKDKSKCLVCGQPIQQETVNEKSNGFNTYTLQEQRTSKSASRSISLKLSDTAIAEVAPVLGNFTNPVLQTPLGTSSVEPQTENISRQTIQEDKLLPQPHESERNGNASNKTIDISGEVASTKVRDYFHIDGDRLSPRTNDFKGQSKKQQQERFSLLFGAAYEQLLGKAPAREHFIEAAKLAGIHDCNYGKYLNSTLKRYFNNIETGYRTVTSASRVIQDIVSEISNPEISGFAYWQGSTKRAKRQSVSSKEATEIQEWISSPSRGDNFETRSLDKGKDFGIFVLHDIIREIGKAQSVKSTLAYEYLKKRYQQIDVSKSSFDTALRRNPDLFHKTSESEFYLSEAAEKTAEEWFQSGRKREA